jgi:SAM-dependent methyltransferase
VIAQCEGCAVLRTLPELSYEELSIYYPHDYWGDGREPTQEWITSSQSEKTDFLRNCGIHGGSILDIGCGSGLFLRALNGSGWERFGLELGPVASEAARNALGESRIHECDLPQAGFSSSSFDVVTLWSALEHTNEPRRQLAEVRRILKIGGVLILQVPNAASYQATWFRGDWFALDAPRHRYHFTEATIARLLQDTGFKPYIRSFKSRTHNVHSLRQSLKSRLLRVRPKAVGRGLFLLGVPLLKPCDSLMSVISQGATITLAARAV